MRTYLPFRSYLTFYNLCGGTADTLRESAMQDWIPPRAKKRTTFIVKHFDSLGRVTFTPYTQTPIRGFVPDDIQVIWMRFIRRHGMASSDTLYELTRHMTGVKNRDNFNDRLKELFDGQMVMKPMAQTFTKNADGHYHLYRLTTKGETFLQKQGLWEEVLPLSGPFPHQMMQATTRAVMDIGCQRHGYRFITSYEYLKLAASKKVFVPFEWDGEMIPAALAGKPNRQAAFDPDDVCAIDYGGGSFIAYMKEDNRNTEPSRSSTHQRRNDRKTLRQLARFIGGKEYKRAYSREAMMMYLYFTVSEAHEEDFLSLVEEEIGDPFYIATGVETAFASPWKPPKLPMHLFEGTLKRAGQKPFQLAKPV